MADSTTAASAISQGDVVAMAALRKSLDMQQQNAAQLIEAVPPAPAPSAGSSEIERLGQNFDQTA